MKPEYSQPLAHAPSPHAPRPAWPQVGKKPIGHLPGQNPMPPRPNQPPKWFHPQPPRYQLPRKGELKRHQPGPPQPQRPPHPPLMKILLPNQPPPQPTPGRLTPPLSP